LTLGLKSNLAVEALALEDYEQAIGEAQRRGVMGGGIYIRSTRRVSMRFAPLCGANATLLASPTPPLTWKSSRRNLLVRAVA
jgi:hypothetical protein